MGGPEGGVCGGWAACMNMQVGGCGGLRLEGVGGLGWRVWGVQVGECGGFRLEGVGGGPHGASCM